MSYIDIQKEENRPKSGAHCVYRININNHYYIGYTSCLSKRFNDHELFIKRIYKGVTLTIKDRKAHKKLISLIRSADNVEVTFEIIGKFGTRKKAFDCEQTLIWDNKDDEFILNSVCKGKKRKSSKHSPG